MENALSYQDVQAALAAQDPGLAALVVALTEQSDPTPETAPREGALTLSRYGVALRDPALSKLDSDGRAAFRRTQWGALEAEDAELPLPPRLKLHQLITELWKAGDAYSRDQLLQIIATVPLIWGPWRGLKAVFKAAEQAQDWEIYGALAARLDVEYANRSHGEVRLATLNYMVRRAWRQLRTVAETLPACYADAAVDVLRFYPEGTNWTKTWISNHIFYHETGKYSRGKFQFWRRPSTLLKHRAYPELWRRAPRPLFTLLQRAESEQVRRFATTALKTDFRATLREVEPVWVARLTTVGSAIVDDFVVWLLQNVPRFEQDAFRTLGLHEPVLALLDSPSGTARKYAASYVLAHARDLDLDTLIRHANNTETAVCEMARDLLRALDPRKGVGLEGWGRLLGTDSGHSLAAEALRKHFGARELTVAWFTERLCSANSEVVDFAGTLLPKVHPYKKLGVSFFQALIDDPRLGWRGTHFALDALESFKVDSLEIDVARRLLVNPATSSRVRDWLEAERLKAADLGMDFLKAVAFEPSWKRFEWAEQLKTSGRRWAEELEFSGALSELVLKLMSDSRRFKPEDLGFEWLMELVVRAEERYHQFAKIYVTKIFLPGDFAEKDEAEAAAEAAPSGEINVDLEGQTFLFTGKLATMTRNEAKKKVSTANGSNASGVTKSLAYLVIGDEGSSLYGSGRKGSKQVKGEKLIAAGAAMRIISETAFLQMLAGEVREASSDDTEAGCERLWEMAFGEGPEDAPLACFARHYLRRHHPEICPAETDRYVDPGAEIPPEFLSFERVAPLLDDSRDAVRSLALLLCEYEFARWQPPMAEVVRLSGSRQADTRAFVSKALTADASPEHSRYRIDPARLTADAVYRFCESLDPAARAIGMALIAANPRLSIPEELFRLTESPDRQVRAFVARQLWATYRATGVTEGWAPDAPPAAGKSAAGKSATKKVSEPEPELESGAKPKPEPPADGDTMRAYLRRSLFGIPPARLPKVRGDGGQRMRPLPARKAKLALIEMFRDLAVEDAGFAERITPLFQEFVRSEGNAERAACLVALTRIRHAHPSLSVFAVEEAA